MATNNIGQGNAAGLIEYLDNIVDKGRATSGAIVPLKTAFKKVMEAVDGKDWGKIQVSEIDVEDYLTRFSNLTRGRYSDQSLSVYKSRVGKAVTWYLKFMEQPGWMPSVGRRSPQSGDKSGVELSRPRSSSGKSGTKAHKAAAGVGAPTVAAELVTYPFPLTGGQIATLNLPANLDENDAKRLERFVDSLVVKGPQRLLGQGKKGEKVEG